MVTKKTSRSPKSAPKSAAPAPAPPAQETKPARKAAAKAPAARARRVATRPKAVVVSDEDIRVRAYFLSLEYQGSDRKDVDFWLLAERELRPAKE